MKRNRKYLIYLLILLFNCSRANAQVLTLNEALKTAFQNNYGIQLVQYEKEITDLQNAPGYAGMLPTVSADGTYTTGITNSEQEYFSGDTRSVTNAGSNSLDAGINLNWTVFDGWRMFATKEKLEELSAMGEIAVRAAMEQTALEISTNWYSLIQLQNAAQVMHQSIDLSQARYAIAQYKKEAGSVSESDVLQAKLDLAADSSALLNLELQIKNVKATINAAMGRDANTAFDVVETAAVQENLSETDIRAKAAASNSMILMAQKNSVIAGLQEKEVRSYLFPEVSLNGSYGYLHSTSESGFIESNLSYGPSVGITLNIPLFNGFTADRNMDQVRIAREMSTVNEAQTTLDVNTQITTLYNEYETAKMLIQLEAANVQSATTSVNIALEKFNAGAITSIDLRIIQMQKINAENRLLTEQLNARLAEIKLLYLAGEIIPQ